MNRKQHYQFSTRYELLTLPNGDLFFNSIKGKHLKLSNPSSLVKDIIGQIGLEKEISSCGEYVSSEYGKEGHNTFKHLIDAFIKKGVIHRSLKKHKPFWVSDTLFERFKTNLEYYQSIGNSSIDSTYEIFERIRNTHITVVGAGGHGSILASQLAMSGIGHLTLIDGDRVEFSNLVRQPYYTTTNGENSDLKVESLQRHIKSITPFTKVTVVPEFLLSKADCEKSIPPCDLVALCADGPRIYINRWINQICTERNTPHIGAFVNQIGPFKISNQDACFGCLEIEYESDFGNNLHTDIVESLQSKTFGNHPSFNTGPFQVANILKHEIFGYLTGLWKPASRNGYIKLNSVGNTDNIALKAKPECKLCSIQRKP